MSEQLQQAIKAIKSRQQQKALQLLVNILKANPQNEIAWLWMTNVVDTDEKRQHCLKQVLNINPQNELARKGLEKLKAKNQTVPSATLDTKNESDKSPELKLSKPVQVVQEEINVSQNVARKRISQPPQTLKISAYLLFAMCLSNLCLVCPFLFVWFGYIQGYDKNNDPNDAPIGLVIVALIYFLAMIAYGVVGYNLLRFKPWAYTATIVLGCIGLILLPPYSTVLSGIILVLVFREETKRVFRQS